uniref:(northern house mosquito) hypothetical protein n=1 Tax=Culex pipiens TaxID=7175 RepID=A0A8D8B2X5_CULPI
MVPYAHQRSNDVERRQYHRNDLKLGHIASGQENGVVVLRKVLAALAGDLRPNQQLVVQSKKYCGCRVEANVPRVLDGLGMFLHPNATPPEDQLKLHELILKLSFLFLIFLFFILKLMIEKHTIFQ